MSNRKRADPAKMKGEHCHRCGSKEVRYLRRTNSIYCRRCGFEWPAPWIDPPKRKGKKR